MTLSDKDRRYRSLEETARMMRKKDYWERVANNLKRTPAETRKECERIEGWKD